jgi:hypothetical protein
MSEHIKNILKKHLRLSETDTRQARLVKLAVLGLIIVGFAGFGYYLGLVMGNLWASG